MRLAKLKRLPVAFFIFLTVFSASCKKDGTQPVVYDAAKQVDIANVAYGADTAQIIDVYLPAGRSAATTKVIVLVHGGSWESGDKSDFNDAIASIRAQLPDYAFFNINYRLANGGKNIYPAALNDVAAAVSFINTKTGDYSVGTQKLILAGASAGAHLAMLYAYSSNAQDNIKAAVDLFGPVDLTWMYFNHPVPLVADAILVNFLGVTPVQNADVYVQASPITFVSATSPPTIIFHGTADDIVPIDESVRLQAKLQSAGVINEFITYNGEGHGWVGANLTDTYNKVIAFLKKNVH